MARRPPEAGVDVAIRPAMPGDLLRCGAIWRAALNDYLGRLNVPPLPDQLDSIGLLHAHTLATDPERFLVAQLADRGASGSGGQPERTRPDEVVESATAAGRAADRSIAPGRSIASHGSAASEAIVGFASALLRGNLWYLSMLFVAPGRQAAGLGRRLLERLLPDQGSSLALAAATDSVQPISNGLYSSWGMVPRMPLVHIAGRPGRIEALPPLPAGASAEPLPAGEPMPPDVHALDREVLGFEHRADHRFAMETGRQAHLIRDGGGRLVGYGYASPVGHVGPVAVRDESLLAPVTGYLLGAVQPRGALAVWVPGAAGETFSCLVRAGLRIDGFPLLLCWSRPFADFTRYLPLSPGLL